MSEKEKKKKRRRRKRIVHAQRLQVHTDTSPLSTDASVFVSRADRIKTVAMQIVGIGDFSELQCQARPPYADEVSSRGEHSNILDY